MSNSFFETVPLSNTARNYAQRGLRARDVVYSFVRVSDKHVIPGTANLSDAGLETRVAYAKSFKTKLSFALRTLIEKSFAPRESPLSSGVFRLLTLSSKTTDSQKRQAKRIPVFCM